MNRPVILKPNDPPALFSQYGGGKAAHLAELTQMGYNVPAWICITSEADFREELEQELERAGLLHVFVAVRSSGIGEDSSHCSFAGIHSSYLYQKGMDQIIDSIQKCRSSCFSERALDYRKQQGLSVDDIQTGVVIQKMVHSEVSGVAFSRDPVNLNRSDHVVINSVWGIGEGLVNGEIEGDLFHVHRKSLDVQKIELPKEKQGGPSLTHAQAQEVAKTVIQLEEHYGMPQDFEWAFADGQLYCLQTRPITTLPPSAYFENLDGAILWDNSNIIESYSGVTTPLTFSFASFCYEEVYRQFCRCIAVPQETIRAYEPIFRNMLGLIRGRIYYNLVNWYRLAILLPGANTNKEFMETMMGVKQALSPELAAAIGFPEVLSKSSLFSRIRLYCVFVWRFITINKIVKNFQDHFNTIYSRSRQCDFKKRSMKELVQFYRDLSVTILKRWQAPIINDCLCMIFFGILKKLTKTWVRSDDPSLQNDLLCGEGGLESAEPTKMLMKIAEKIDRGDASFRQWFLDTASDQIMGLLKAHSEEIYAHFQEFLERFGFRCVNELKLEAQDLHDDPTFVIDAVANYVRMKKYSLSEMLSREQMIRASAETRAFSNLAGVRKWIYRFVLENARRAIRDRENMRFSRTKIFGIVRQLFRSLGSHFARLGVIQAPSDVFYLTVDEIFSYIEGRSVHVNLLELVERRKMEFDQFEESPSPPDRFVTLGPVGFSVSTPSLFSSYSLDPDSSSDQDLLPNMLKGTPCSPGIVEGVVRVVNDLSEARGLNGEILVTPRTDPGWVPLYPSCSGLLIERGSLLSHSAVVARELGLPTIVGISGGLMQKLKTGMRVRMDGASGIVEII
ncbi:MAG: phosphoenolpyruvate synthase [Parachlamydiales bacterium]|nr:phosphoenolpyruvate synthase [Parachlamydiales bacterium]